MRLALVGRYFNRQGGVSRVLAELADRAANEHDVDVYSYEVLDRGSCRANFVHVPMVERVHWLQVPTFSRGVNRRLRERPHDLVHVIDSQATGGDLYTAQSCAAAWLSQARAAAPVKGLLSRVYPPHVAAKVFERRCLVPDRSAVVAVSNGVRADLVTQVGLDPERVHVIYNGVDADVFTPADSRAEARAELDAADRPRSPDATVLLFVGHYFQRKGLDPVIRAFSRAALPNAELWVIGSDEPAPYRRLARESGVADAVRFLGHRPNVERYMRAADAFVLPTRYEPFGLVILEALACGTPVVTARSAGAAELTRDGSEAILLDDPWDVAELAAALRRLAEARERWPQMSAAARAAAMPWTWDAIWRQTSELYSELLERRYAGGARRASARSSSPSSARTASSSAG